MHILFTYIVGVCVRRRCCLWRVDAFLCEMCPLPYHPTSVLMHCLHSCLDASLDDYDEYIHSLCLFLAVRDDNVVRRICSN
mmetsp:Transcript_17019/g.24060  ORF Transcript_17019/g.24060 Transcript_17019/m.24060 type:complete len:81 (-) Transcript_17019:368-610(-)